MENQVLLSGNQAVARGAWEAGVQMATAYPGSPVTSIMDAAMQFQDIRTQWAANEKVALEIAAGVAYAGARALVVMKHVGLNVAADPLFNLAYTGVAGGLVIVVGDDPGAKSSQNEQDTRLLAQAAGVPVLEPSSGMEALIFTKLAFAISEAFDLPVIVRMTTPLCYGYSRIVTSFREEQQRPLSFARPQKKYLLLPQHAPLRHKIRLENLAALAKSAWSDRVNSASFPSKKSTGKYPFGVICAGHTTGIVIELFEQTAPILQLGMVFPFNDEQLLSFANRCEKILIVEESSHLIETHVRQLGVSVARRRYYDAVGEFELRHLLSDDLPQIEAMIGHIYQPPQNDARMIPIKPVYADDAPQPGRGDASNMDTFVRPPGFCAGCSHTGIFYTLSQRQLYVIGDIGCYTLGAVEPLNALHANLCMGASIGILQGYLAVMDEEQSRQAVAVIGDSTFFHSGIPSLLSAVQSNRPGTLLILDNNGTAMTGFQMTNRPYNKQDWYRLLIGLGVKNFAVIDALDLKEINTKLDEFLASTDFSVLVLKGSCVQSLPHRGPTNYRYSIHPDLCSGCGECLKTNCPAIVKKAMPIAKAGEKRTLQFEITNECIGCGLCSQTCPERAIMPLTVSFKNAAATRIVSKVRWHRVIRALRAVPPLRRLLDRFEKELF